MPDIPNIPRDDNAITRLDTGLCCVIAFIAISFVAGVWHGGPSDEKPKSKMRWGLTAAIGMTIWLVIGAIVPMSDLLETKMLPPPPLFLIGASFLLAVSLVCSPIGRRLASLPFAALIGFHAFRLPLELILHNWYEGGTLPVQMTFSGHNFDIATGLLAIVFGIWATVAKIPRAAVWLFNIAGTILLAVVTFIAITSSPVPFRQYTNEPQVLLVFHFPTAGS